MPSKKRILTAAEVAEWERRELARFTTGEYTLVPWSGQSWWYGPQQDLRHFTHLSRSQPGLLAYSFSAEHGVADRQTRCKPGRYLKRYYGEVVSPQDISKMSAQLSALQGSTLEFARTREDIRRVYENGPRSCMSAHASEYRSSSGSATLIHPCEVYATPDVAVAYLRTPDGTIKCRTLTRTEPKQYTVVYGDGGGYSEVFVGLLHAEGYTEDFGFHGVRLLRIPTAHRHPGWAGPYLDCRPHGVEYVDDTYWRLVDTGEFRCESQYGMMLDSCPECAGCDRTLEPDYVYTAPDGSTWCEGCYSNEWQRCTECSTECRREDMKQHHDRWYCESCAAGLVACPKCEARVHEQRLRTARTWTHQGDASASAYTEVHGCRQCVRGDECMVCEVNVARGQRVKFDIHRTMYDGNGNVLHDVQHCHMREGNTYRLCPTCTAVITSLPTTDWEWCSVPREHLPRLPWGAPGGRVPEPERARDDSLFRIETHTGRIQPIRAQWRVYTDTGTSDVFRTDGGGS